MFKIIKICLSLGFDDETIDHILDGYCRIIYGYSYAELIEAARHLKN